METFTGFGCTGCGQKICESKCADDCVEPDTIPAQTEPECGFGERPPREEGKLKALRSELNAAKGLEIFRSVDTCPGVEGDVERLAEESLLQL